MSNIGNTYTEEYRRDAVELLQSSGRPISRSAILKGRRGSATGPENGRVVTEVLA